MVNLPEAEEDPWAILILLLLEHHLSNQQARTLQCRHIPELITLLHSGREESLRWLQHAPSNPSNRAIHSPNTTYNMADEHYVLLQEPQEFTQRFTLIFTNTINHIKSLHYEHHHNTIKIITRVINLLQSNPSGPVTTPLVLSLLLWSSTQITIPTQTLQSHPGSSSPNPFSSILISPALLMIGAGSPKHFPFCTAPLTSIYRVIAPYASEAELNSSRTYRDWSLPCGQANYRWWDSRTNSNLTPPRPTNPSPFLTPSSDTRK